MSPASSPRVLDSLALALFLNGEPEKAAAAERRAIRLLGDEESPLRAELEKKLAKYVAAAEEAGLDIPDE